MSVVFSRGNIDSDKMRRKGRAWVGEYIDDLRRVLGDPLLTPQEYKAIVSGGSEVGISQALALQRRLPAPPERLRAGLRVNRDDGRFYIPIYRGDKIVARVASDAFEEDEVKAGVFAMLLVASYNLVEA
ncbi:hypothetical protein BAJUN_00450 [Bajunvirus bajun]|uniref:Uncharacterized protein n=1 Tax=Brevundimonas phage vB_BgoS-Bajun TaxID=2948594 RepID=A0A9E7SU12_9CAUD|nr:hypothetical protein BAJUN_00450 [Brevundimonas phage vB_BgoS-Bajun]